MDGGFNAFLSKNGNLLYFLMHRSWRFVDVYSSKNKKA
jgi:hypothetical protein